jgi:small subunit ribosomal protein S21
VNVSGNEDTGTKTKNFDDNRQSSNGTQEHGRSDQGRSDHRGHGGEDSREGRPYNNDRQRAGAMEVTVEHNIEKAMKILKRKLIKEGLFKELKSRRYYEKPSERKKRKSKESIKKIRKDEARNKKNVGLFT